MFKCMLNISRVISNIVKIVYVSNTNEYILSTIEKLHIFLLLAACLVFGMCTAIVNIKCYIIFKRHVK